MTTGPERDSERPLRRDAQRSRELVLVAARALFAERGVEVGFDEIAKRAGVGVGTVYRRFPDRTALVEALFADRIEDVIADAGRAEAIADPREALESFMLTSVRAQQADRGLLQVMATSEPGTEQLRRLRVRAVEAVDRLLRRAQDAGVVRADLTPFDLVLSLHLMSRMTTADHAEVWRRPFVLLLESLAPRSGQQPLPDPPLTAERFEEIVRRL